MEVQPSDNKIVHIKPKELKRRYKSKDYKVIFDPDNRVWKWIVEHVNVTRFDGEADSLTKALKAAERHIDTFTRK